ncbi:MAG: type II toxin-antitoxin system VapC family toxin [Nitrososphaerota archaeon]|nr:type II toxin-antitoxin system VapC family toxin [Candidatus Calditenuaceae archaeon]MDW8073595.1 type II toxin-antitoxin system VapC family toxin [Nitrososphaerota archaeon]
MKILLDTNVYVAAKNREDNRYSEAITLIEHIDEGRLRCVVPTIVIAELCAGYYQMGDPVGADELLTGFITSPSYEIASLDHKTACEAGRLRAELGLRLPDAIIVATALTTNANAIVTYDVEMNKSEPYVKVVEPSKIRLRW